MGTGKPHGGQRQCAPDHVHGQGSRALSSALAPAKQPAPTKKLATLTLHIPVAGIGLFRDKLGASEEFQQARGRLD